MPKKNQQKNIGVASRANVPRKNIASVCFVDDFLSRYPRDVLETLLFDRTTGHNIIWASDAYAELGEGYAFDNEMTIEHIADGNANVVRPRVAKNKKSQARRTKTHAEVFTPSWLCNTMLNCFDEEWLGRRDMFNIENDNHTWRSTDTVVKFPQNSEFDWRAYVVSTCLEITCGEAPFVCSRYDTATGDIIGVHDRIGFLDRKLRIVAERSSTKRTWYRNAIEALKASYGYEYQGDNLLIARLNVFETFFEHMLENHGCEPTVSEMNEVAGIVSWNFWQMDGLTYAPPSKCDNVSAIMTNRTRVDEPQVVFESSLFDLFEDSDNGAGEYDGENGLEDDEYYVENNTSIKSLIYDWEADEPIEFISLKECYSYTSNGVGKMGQEHKKFFGCIGNPPYQDETIGDNTSYAPPLYNIMMNAAFDIAERVEMITPARFLFNAGSTPKSWNEEMLNDEHFKVLKYEADASKIFPGTDIKGGVAVTYRDETKTYDPIKAFIPNETHKRIALKVSKRHEKSINETMYASKRYKFTDIIHRQTKYDLDALYSEFPEARNIIGSNGKDKRFRSNAFEKLPFVFTDEKTADDDMRVLGFFDGKRTWRYIGMRFVDQDNPTINKWKVFLPQANGSGALGEVLSTPLIGAPLTGHTQTFISIGCFDTEDEAQACMKYIKSKFARVMLGILKVTQMNNPDTWRYVPLQDFTADSDIDWSQSVADIDRQLYEKYGLDENEIEFIEQHVKEMD